MAKGLATDLRPRPVRWLRVALPVAVLLFGVAGAVSILALRPPLAHRQPSNTAPLVRVVIAELSSESLVVRADGTVRARSESDLVPEVSGRVFWVSPSLRPGGFFEPGEVLLRIEAADYDIGRRQMRAGLERARGELELAELNLARQQGLRSRDASSLAKLDDARARARVARAAVLDADATLERAERDFERTELRAPFAGRVLEEHVDLGQFVSRGTPVATLYAIDVAEIRLPIPDEELAFLDLPLGYHGEAPSATGPDVRVHARFAGREHTWLGHVVRTEGQIDRGTRMVHVVVEVADPYGRGTQADRPPLAVGLFVEAEILGLVAEGVVALPRRVLRTDVSGAARVWLVDAEGRLRSRKIEVLRLERERVLVSAGLQTGERVLLSPLATPVEGMQVEIYRSGDVVPSTAEGRARTVVADESAVAEGSSP